MGLLLRGPGGGGGGEGRWKIFLEVEIVESKRRGRS